MSSNFFDSTFCPYCFQAFTDGSWMHQCPENGGYTVELKSADEETTSIVEEKLADQLENLEEIKEENKTLKEILERQDLKIKELNSKLDFL